MKKITKMIATTVAVIMIARAVTSVADVMATARVVGSFLTRPKNRRMGDACLVVLSDISVLLPRFGFWGSFGSIASFCRDIQRFLVARYFVFFWEKPEDLAGRVASKTEDLSPKRRTLHRI